MPTPFPGMDPYLERPGIWHQVHTGLIIDIQKSLAPRLRPNYQVAVEQRTYLALLEAEEELVGEPGVLVVASSGTAPVATAHATTAVASATNGAYTVQLPARDDIMERYLEVRDVATGEAVTVIEILSPSNKMGDRPRYERKRLKILNSMTHLVEIDLLRSGAPMTMYGDIPESHYRVLISRSEERPNAQALLFGLRKPILDVPIPLRPGEEEPILPLNQILHDLYDQAGYDLFIDYTQPPTPPLTGEDAEWASQVAASAA